MSVDRDVHSLSRVVVPATLDRYFCQRPVYKILVKVRNSKKNVLKIVLIIVNINKDENESLFQINSLLKITPPPHFLENYCADVKVKNDHKSFLRENLFEMSDLFSSLLIFTIIKTILSTFFYCF